MGKKLTPGFWLVDGNKQPLLVSTLIPAAGNVAKLSSDKPSATYIQQFVDGRVTWRGGVKVENAP